MAKKAAKSTKKATTKKSVNFWESQNFVIVAFVLFFALAGTILLRSTFAAKPVSASIGSCSASPDPVALGADYTLTATNLGSGTIVNVLTTDSMGTTSWNLQADNNGTTSVTWHSYSRGTTNVKMQVHNKNKWQQVGSCSFQVV